MLRIALLALLSSGCSFLFVDGPPDRWREMPSFDCSEGYGWPILDGVFAASMVASAVGTSQADERTAAAGGLTTGLITAGLFVASLAVGFSRVGNCRDAKEEHARRPPAPLPEAPSPSTPPRPPPPGELPPGWKR